jgi:ATP-binding cassette subfamily B protein
VADPARRAAAAGAGRLGGELRACAVPLPVAPKQAALADFTLQVSPGETVALVGPSGAGKSTVLQLLLRFYDTQRGTVRVDGVPVRDASLGPAPAHRHRAAGQHGVLDQRAGEHPLRPARRQRRRGEGRRQGRLRARLHQALPEGYATFLGERGVRLSGGQRQRISIARAMLKNPPLLLLDEATSALDAESERMVQAALEAAMKDRTTLVIAHRLATVLRADRIVVLEAAASSTPAPMPSWWRAAGCTRGWRRCSSTSTTPLRPEPEQAVAGHPPR